MYIDLLYKYLLHTSDVEALFHAVKLIIYPLEPLETWNDITVSY